MGRKWFVIVLLAWAWTWDAWARPVVPRLLITTETSVPDSMLQDGEIVGAGTEKVREIMQRSGVSYHIELLPWKRAYTAALTDSNACVYSTARTPEREKLFKWVGPIDEVDWVLMGRTDHSFQLNSLDDARPLRIGTYNGDARDDYLRMRGFQVDSAPNDLLNPKKLLLNRVDLWAASRRRGSAMLEQNGWAGKIVPLLIFNHIRVYLACNRAVPNALIGKMNAAAATMVRDGTTGRIDRRYANWVEQGGPAR